MKELGAMSLENLGNLIYSMDESQLKLCENLIYGRRKVLEAKRKVRARYADQLATLINEIQEAGFDISLYIDEDEIRIHHNDDMDVGVD